MGGSKINVTEFEALLEKNRNRTLVINFWALYCKGCLPKTARMEREARKPINKDIRFIFINLDPPGPGRDYAEVFMKDMHKNVYPHFSKEPDPRSFMKKIAPDWQAILPAVFVINPEGKLQNTCIGNFCEPGWR